MITRIVKLTLKEENINAFLEHFKAKSKLISGFEGCSSLKLLKQGPIIFTYSQWRSEAHLENYRQSDLFKETWRVVKPLFDDKAEAWSTEEIFDSAEH